MNQLADMLESENDWISSDATRVQRLLNLLIDVAVIRFICYYVVTHIFNLIMVSFFYDFAVKILSSRLGSNILYMLLMLSTFMMYYIFCERALKGITFGKYITGSKAIRVDKKELTLQDVLLRSLIRLFPLDIISGLSARPWHDAWTKTKVVRTR